MQLRDILAMALIAGALPAAAAACGARSMTIDGYGDDSGDEDDDGGTTSTSTWSTSTWSTSTWTDTWTTSTWTDTWTSTAFCDSTSFDCSSCQECAINGECSDEVAYCSANAECQALLGCVNDCDLSCENDPDPDGCFDYCTNGPMGCAEVYPGGIADLNTLLECVFVQQCPTMCEDWP